ncbi:MAG: ribosome biogenesis GTPase Der [Pseudomonadaceae bacterium]|nr:ribosome biogenesis GTPase Der [Pseudomonadaceae bacterium]
MSRKPALPVLAIVGRPNVGKSTLFNLLTTEAKALVHATAGTTRDVRRVAGKLFDLDFILLDTAGLEDGADGLAADLNKLALAAAEMADILVFVVDGKAGLTPADRALAQRLRKLDKPLLLAVNKADVNAAEDTAAEAETLGFGAPLLLSAAHGQGLDGLHAALAHHIAVTPLPDGSTEDEDEEPTALLAEKLAARAEQPIKLAIVGKPNVGKSTFVNALLKEDKMLTGPTAGLTREAIGHPFAFMGQKMVLVDTPGLRRKAKVVDDLEGMSVGQSITAIRSANMVVLMVDASGHSRARSKWKVFEAQDAKIADVIVNEHKPLIVALNKWDAVEEPDVCLDDARWQLQQTLHSIHQVDIVPLSAINAKGVGAVMKRVIAQHKLMHTRVSTAKLNKLLEVMITRRPPPLAGGKAVKLKYMTQIKSRPPVFSVFGNRVGQIPNSYKHYLRNQLVQQLGIAMLPVRILFKGGKNPFEGKK